MFTMNFTHFFQHCSLLKGNDQQAPPDNFTAFFPHPTSHGPRKVPHSLDAIEWLPGVGKYRAKITGANYIIGSLDLKEGQFCWWPFWDGEFTWAFKRLERWPPTVTGSKDSKGHGLNHRERVVFLCFAWCFGRRNESSWDIKNVWLRQKVHPKTSWVANF